MATRSVPTKFATIQAAVNGAQPGDLIEVASGYADSELIQVSVNNLTFSIPAGVTGIVLVAGAGVHDIALAGSSPVQIIGNGLSNDFVGNAGANYISDGGGGDDTLNGGGGNDIILVTGGVDSVNGSSGTGDVLVVDYSATGSAVSNTASTVTDGASRTVTFAGVERLTVYGGTAGDTLTGGAASDTFVGGGGNDTLAGGAGSNFLEGDGGNDTISDSGTGSNIYGGGGIDKVTLDRSAVASNISIDFVAGQDFSFADSLITSVTEAELLTVTTGSGNDSVSVKGMSAAGSTFIDGGTGVDSATVDFSHALAAVNGSYGGSGLVTDGTTSVSLFNLEHLTLIGGSGNDALSADAGNDTLKGNAGNDSLDGEAGNDRLDGGIGNDTLTGGTGTNVLNGGDGNDTLSDSGKGSTINGGTGTDKLTLDRSAVTSPTTVNFVSGQAMDVADGLITKVSETELLTVTTGTGNDSVSVKGMAAAGSTFIDGGTGVDSATVDFSHATAAVNGSYGGSGLVTDATTSVSLFNLEHLTLIGGSGNDALSADAGNDTLKGNAGNDSLDGEAGNDRLDGGTGNDTLTGGTGTNVLNGEAGNDTLSDSGKGSTINGGTGTDKLTLDRSAVTANMTVNFVSGQAMDVADGLITKVSETELLTVTTGSGNDSVSVKGMAAAGSTFIDGGTGVDSATVDFSHATAAVNGSYGGSGLVADGTTSVSLFNLERLTLIGGSGNDALSADAGNDTLKGNAGNDSLDGEAGNDRLDGGIGNDTLIGGTGTNVLNGEAGNDTLSDSGKGSTINGGIGTDKLTLDRSAVTSAMTVNFVSGQAMDVADGLITKVSETELLTVTTGTGNDSVSVKGMAAAGSTFIDGGTGVDSATVDFSHATAAVNGSYGGSGLVADGTTSVSLFNLEHLTLIGGSGNDALSADAGNDTLKGNAGNDALDGEAGNDRLDGGTGNDTLTGGTGTNVLNGGDGNDTLSDSGKGSTINGGIGIDKLTLDRSAVTANMTVNFVSGQAMDVADGLVTKVSETELLTVTTGTGNDSVSVKGMSAAGSTFIDGGTGVDSATVDFSHATAAVNGSYGGSGLVTDGTTSVSLFNLERLTLIGGSGNDALSADAGNDTLKGNAGNDALDGEAGNDRLDGGAGADSLSGGVGNDMLTGGAGADTLTGGSGTDTASYATATAGVVASLATPASNTNDAAGDSYSSIEGLLGSAFADTLTGTSGANILNGGGGLDTVRGGSGADTFVFDHALVAGNIATIVDFLPGTDIIQLSRSIFSAAGPAGALNPNAFFVGTAAHDADDRIIYNSMNGNLSYDADGNGAGAAQTFAVVNHGLAMSATNFQLV